MDKYKRFYGIALFVIVLAGCIWGAIQMIVPKLSEIESLDSQISNRTIVKAEKAKEEARIRKRLEELKNSATNTQKKIYSPIESDVDNDSLFFTLYTDIIEMVHTSSVKMKGIKYNINPENDEFVKYGKGIYFVCDVDMELVSNYKDLGKLIENIYSYPYYIKISNLEVKPYQRDKKILLSKLSIRLYAHTTPELNG